jgi:meiotically up-regulated gene 157 (Mug157) protein
MQRRKFIQLTAMSGAAFSLSKYSIAGSNNDYPVVRTTPGMRKFTSKSVEKIIADIKKNIGNKEIAWMFENCFPNTLDTAVDFEMINGRPDTYVITGDIDAMWLRDSSAQVWPYLPLCKEDGDLRQLIKGVINRQVKCILKDPYANAFYKDENKISEWKETDITEMKPGIHERKWEIDSLCYPIRLAHGYWKETGDISSFDDDWLVAMQLVIKTFKEQQRFHNHGPYSFQRKTSWATDGVPLGGYGYPVKPDGLICSMFRPSDDATIYPCLIPSNLFAIESLAQMKEITQTLTRGKHIAADAELLAKTIRKALQKNAIIPHEKFGSIYAYEVNGFGSINLMDDANVPSLLSLPYLNAVKWNDPVYQNTRRFVLSQSNPFFFKGGIGEGIGSPHTGMEMIWPISIIMRGLTSNNNAEIKNCIQILQKTHAGTGFMHESFYKDDANKFTRKWFAWANTLFGEFIWKIFREKKELLD